MAPNSISSEATTSNGSSCNSVKSNITGKEEIAKHFFCCCQGAIKTFIFNLTNRRNLITMKKKFFYCDVK